MWNAALARPLHLMTEVEGGILQAAYVIHLWASFDDSLLSSKTCGLRKLPHSNPPYHVEYSVV